MRTIEEQWEIPHLKRSREMEYIGSKDIRVYAINVITLIHDVASGVGTRVQVGITKCD